MPSEPAADGARPWRSGRALLKSWLTGDGPEIALAPLVALGAVLMALLAAGDALLSPARAGFMVVVWAFALGAGAGGLAALSGGLLLRGLYFVPRWAAFGLWLALGLGLTTYFLVELGVLARLDGPYRKLAIAALLASGGAGLGLAAVATALQPSRGKPAPWIRARPLWMRLAFGAAFLAAAIGMIGVDRYWMSGDYPAVFAGLRWGALTSLLVALLGLLPSAWLLGSQRDRILLATVGVSLLFPVVTLRGKSADALSSLLARPFPATALRLLRGLTDLDRDGYSALLGGGDCDDLSASINPGQREIPGNGRDDNCLAGDAKPRAASADPTRLPPMPETPPLSIVLISVDTLRTDRMSLYGAQRKTTPNLDEWARREAVRFDRAYASGAWTGIAMSSLFRGVYPRRLDWTRIYKTTSKRLLRQSELSLRKGERLIRVLPFPLAEKRPPLQWWMQRRGMATFSVFDDGHSQFLSPKLQIVGPFEHDHDVGRLKRKQREDAGVTSRALQILKKDGSKPWFLWLHYFGPHNPSTQHADVESFGSSVYDRYDHEIAALDRALAPLLAELSQRRQQGERIAVVLTADHGEDFGPRSRFHGFSTAEGVVHVPLLLAGPGIVPGSSDALVNTLDIFPTLMSLANIPLPAEIDGIDLRRSIAREPGLSSRIVLSETWMYDANGVLVANEVAVRDRELKLTRNLRENTKSLVRYREAAPQNLIDRLDAPRLESFIDEYLDNAAIELHD
jgi:arylsulfatase A-like enzyme